MTAPRSDTAPVIVDARGMRCPWPVLRAARAMRDAGHVDLIADDPVAEKDIPDLAHVQGWHCAMTRDGAATRYTLTK